MIFRAPPVLTIHLKRFQRNGYSYSKDNTNVQFPITFDLAPYMCKYADVRVQARVHSYVCVCVPF
jgi:ubiquitin C-terminal hydrolase